MLETLNLRKNLRKTGGWGSGADEINLRKALFLKNLRYFCIAPMRLCPTWGKNYFKGISELFLEVVIVNLRKPTFYQRTWRGGIKLET